MANTSFININTYYDDGATEDDNTDNILSNELNEFAGWKCWAGVQSIAIRNDGSVYRAVCKEGGPLGNIYEGFSLPEGNEPITCTRLKCTCSADVQLAKAKPGHEYRLRASTQADDKISRYKELKNKQLPDKILSQVYADTFCVVPFSHVSTSPYGDIKLCCRAQSEKVGADYPDITKDNLQEYWQGDYMNGVRQSLIDGKKIHECSNCWKMEANNVDSMRETRNAHYCDHPGVLENIEYFLENKKIEFKIQSLELKLSNACNLKCRMCWPKDSSLWIDDWDDVAHFYEDDYIEKIIDKYDLKENRVLNLFEDSDTFISDMDKLSPSITQMSFSGGEPLIDPIHKRLLVGIKNPENIELAYSTNLNIKPAKLQKYVDIWKGFKEVVLTVSIDGYKDNNDYIRRESDWKLIMNNIEMLKEQLGVTSVKVSTCISALNVPDLAKIIKWVADDMKTPYITSRLQWPEFLNANILEPFDIMMSIGELDELYTEFEYNVKHMKEADDTNRYDKWRYKRYMTAIKSMIGWLNQCIDNNKHTAGTIDTLNSFNTTLDSIDLENK